MSHMYYPFLLSRWSINIDRIQDIVFIYISQSTAFEQSASIHVENVMGLPHIRPAKPVMYSSEHHSGVSITS